MKEYNPRPRTREILVWVLDKIQSVPYSVSLRWAFYRCVQELGLTKKDYGNFKRWTAKARKMFWNGWNPTTLVDDTREILRYGNGFKDFRDWVRRFEDEEPVYEKFSTQDNLVMIWFEAQAMRSQFEHYAGPYNVPLAPFKGDPSIEYKWRIAEFLADLYLKFGPKPIKILYFGDYEPIQNTGSRGKGIRIPLDALKDIRPWFNVIVLSEKIGEMGSNPEKIYWGDRVPEFEFVRCGLNPEHIEKWSIPENPTRPSEYQWEALDDVQAEKLIQESIERYWSKSAIEEIVKRERDAACKWQRILKRVRRELA